MNTALDANTIGEAQKIIANEITLVDRNGKPRIRLVVEDDGTAAVKFLDGEERLRMALYLKEPNVEDDDYLFAEGSDNDAGLIVTGRGSGASIRLGISYDGLFGRRARLEVTEGPGYGRKRHRFPALPPNVGD
jgi:hypothetical protein